MIEPAGIQPASGKLGVLLVGFGAVSTTTMAGIMLARRGLASPIGSLTQLGRMPLGSATPQALLRERLPLAELAVIELGGWDIFPANACEAAQHAGVLDRHHLEAISGELARIEPMTAVFDADYLPRLRGVHVKATSSKQDAVEQIRADLRKFKRERQVERLVVIWCASTERQSAVSAAHRDIASFERALIESDAAISPTQIYAWACLKEGVPFANGAPNVGAEFPAALSLASETRAPVAGKDFKSGQTLLKTAIAPALKARMLGVDGWYSTNILGNRDAEVLDDPSACRAKEATKLGVLDGILDAETYPELYGNCDHRVRIDYYRPRGDAKESWDSIDIRGFLGYPMQLKLNFLCRDSILAAPLVLDLALWLDLAQRAGLHGCQDWLGFYFKAPLCAAARANHDLFAQLTALEGAISRFVVAAQPTEAIIKP